jgi:predicted alpha/beta-hydrolase family hydrolase
MAERLRIELGAGDSVTALAYGAAAERAGITLILAHGAGAGQTSAFMVRFAGDMAARGIDCVTFNFLYTERGRRLPDPSDRLEACWLAAIAAIRANRALSAQPLAIGGKSMGGRIASQVAAAGGASDLAGLVLLGYPLHPPGKPEQLRIRHLARVRAPTLFVQGARDSYGTPEELRPILAERLPDAALYVIAEGDHSFKLPKRAALSQKASDTAISDHVGAWLRRQR